MEYLCLMFTDMHQSSPSMPILWGHCGVFASVACLRGRAFVCKPLPGVGYLKLIKYHTFGITNNSKQHNHINFKSCQDV